MNSRLMSTLVACSVLAFAGLAHAQPQKDSSAARPAAGKIEQKRANETLQLEGVVKAVDKERITMVVKAGNGQEYSLPITKGVGDTRDLVGKKIKITVSVSVQPLTVGVVVSF